MANDCSILNLAKYLDGARSLGQVGVKLRPQLRGGEHFDYCRTADAGACCWIGRGPRRNNQVGPRRCGCCVFACCGDCSPLGGSDGPSQGTCIGATRCKHGLKKGGRSCSDCGRRRIHGDRDLDRERTSTILVLQTAATTSKAKNDYGEQKRKSTKVLAPTRAVLNVAARLNRFVNEPINPMRAGLTFER